MKYEVIIEETISQKFVVEADSVESALEISKQNYKSGKFVLDQADVSHKQIACVGANEHTEWEVF